MQQEERLMTKSPESSLNLWAEAIKTASSSRRSLQIFASMHRNAVSSDSFSVLYAVKSAANLRNLRLIRHLHSHILKLGRSTHVFIATSLLKAYVDASFPEARVLFDEMPERNTVTWNTMISGYSRCGEVGKAREVFDSMPNRDAASWSAMIDAYVSVRDWNLGFAVFREMVVNDKVKPDEFTVSSVLSGLVRTGLVGLVLGRSVHGFMVKNDWEIGVELGTVLVDMYAKCGSLNYATRVFELMKVKNVVTWTTLICGFAQHGHGKEAVESFEMMRNSGVRPNEMTFTGILSACAYSGLVDEGREYFKMIEEYGLEPTVHHYGCLVDLLGKAGFLEEAYDVIRRMNFEPNAVIWGSFLLACKRLKKFEMVERVMEQVLRTITPENNGGVYSLISDLYVSNEKWDNAERLRKFMVDQHVRKPRGSSFI